MKGWLKFLFGAEATLKRETVIIIWFLLIFIIVRLYAFTPPDQVDNFDGVTGTLLWAMIALLAAIFGIQVVPVMSGRSSRVEERHEVTETVTERKPATDPPPDFAES